MPSMPPQNPNADKARAAIREYAGLPVVHIPQHAPTKLDPLRAALIAATVDVVTGVCLLRDEAGLPTTYTGDDTVGVVTWAGREWDTSAAHPAGQAAEKEK